MDPIKMVSRIILGLILIASGGLLLFFYDPATTLPHLLERFTPLKALKPYHVEYFRINASLFCVSGLLTILNLRLATIIQIFASLMFILTFDNFTLYCSWDFKVQKIIYIICHIAVIAAIFECHEAKKETEKKKTE